MPELGTGVEAELCSLVAVWEEWCDLSSVGSGFLDEDPPERELELDCDGLEDGGGLLEDDFFASSSRLSGYISKMSTSRSLSSA